MAKRACIIRHHDYYELPLRREAEALQAAGYVTDVICLRGDDDPLIERIDGVRLYRIPLRRRRGGRLRYVADYAAFVLAAGFIVTALHVVRPYRVVQVNTMPDLLVLATMVVRALGAKVVVFIKEPAPELALTLYGSRWLARQLAAVEQFAIRHVDAAFTVTQQLKDRLVSRGADASLIHVVLNGPDPAHMQASATEHDVKAFTIVCHGTIESRYGHLTILAAIRIALEHVPHLQVVLVGAGTMTEEVMQAVAESGLASHVSYLGWVSSKDLNETLGSADVGVVALERSPYSCLVHTNKMFEFMLFGKPVIASRLPAVEAYVPDDCIRYFTPGDAEDLARAIVDLAACPSLRQRLAANARRRYVATYSWERQRHVYLDVYRRLIDEPLGTCGRRRHGLPNSSRRASRESPWRRRRYWPVRQ